MLRINGVHTSTEFWVPTTHTGELTPNTRFADRFVGETLARMPRSIRITERPSRETLRVVVFGESAALGDPEPAFGMSRCLEAILEHRFPGRSIEIINTAITALNSYAIREAAKGSRRLNSDFWVIYAGNNEVVGPFGPSSVVSGSPPGLSAIRMGLWVRTTAIGQWIAKRKSESSEGFAMTQRWIGLEHFLNRQVKAEDPRLNVMRENFRANLHDTVNFGVGSGAKVLLGTMAVNLVDCAPFSSESALSTNTPLHSRWLSAATIAREADERGAWAEAIGAWTNAFSIWPKDAETAFRLGLARLNADQITAGRADLETARDLDTLRFRADSGINQITRSVAQSNRPDSVRLVDADRELKGLDPKRPPGMDLFLEHVHLRPQGNYRLARLFAEQIVSWLGESGSTNLLGEQACLARLGWTPFAESRLWTQTRMLCERPPFSHQSNAELRSRFLDDRIAEANRTARHENLNGYAAKVRSLVDRHPADWNLREQLARLLQTARRLPEASVEWRQVVEKAPGHVVGWYQLGESLAGAGDRLGAQRAYEQALRIRPDFVEASIGLGYVLGELKNFSAAVLALERALNLSPRNLQARVNRGVALIGMGRFAEAIADFKQAAEEHPMATTPLMRLGEFLSDQKSYNESSTAYAEASRRDTNNAALRHRLAIELSRAGRTNESEAEFHRVIQQVPNSAVVRTDWGVALTKQSRLREAMAEFEEALKLQPTNALARSYLQQVRTYLEKEENR